MRTWSMILLLPTVVACEGQPEPVPSAGAGVDATQVAPEVVEDVLESAGGNDLGLPQPSGAPNQAFVASPAPGTLPPEISLEGTQLLEERYASGRPKLRRTVKRVDDGIVNHGEFKKWLENTVLAEEGFYLDGEKHGLYVMRWDTGLERSRVEYERGVEHGHVQRWTENGQLLYEAQMVHGKPQGLEREFWPNSRPRVEAHWDGGVPHGSSKRWNAKGVLIEEGQSEHGARIGAWTLRRADGTLERVEHYVAGRLDGLTSEYDTAARLSAERNYRAGQPHGEHVEYWPDGQPRTRTNYVDGRQTGTCSTWYEDGTPQSQGQLEAGVRVGPWKFWNPDHTPDLGRSGEYVAGERRSGS